MSATHLPLQDIKYAIASVEKVWPAPDTTAVILNWSRLENVILICSLLCGQWLNDIVAQVFIWNNNMNMTLTNTVSAEACRLKMARQHFLGTGCHPEKLRIHNSRSNDLFEARFLACANASTKLCFTQDDDYLVQPEVIRNMHTFFEESASADSLHLSPAHEHLLSKMRTVSVRNSSIRTSFVWLGYGTYLKRKAAVDFLHLMRKLNATNGEIKMADNYYTILANHDKRGEIWFDHGIELGGGQPFTVGFEGDIRNEKHMTRALHYLSNSTGAPGAATASAEGTTLGNSTNSAPCRVTSCVLHSNIELIPDNSTTILDTPDSFSPEVRRKWLAVGDDHRTWYTRNPLSAMVDGRAETKFVSFGVARRGEWLIVDALGFLHTTNRGLQLVLLVSNEMEELLRNCTYDASLDQIGWVDISSKLTCSPIEPNDTRTVDLVAKECFLEVPIAARYFRLSYGSSGAAAADIHWVIWEIWLRHIL